MKTIAIAGATGFVGTALIQELAARYRVIALTRGSTELRQKDAPSNVEWRKCNLFSLLETEQALTGVDYAIYLVHSMLPEAELTQAHFQDLDLLVADNFARASARHGVQQIIYLGGIIPDDKDLSPHLASREEVEVALASRGVALTTLRAALILGAGGSSLNIILMLIQRLPIMICPKWTQNRSAPIHLDDVMTSISYSLGRKECFHRIYDIAGQDTVNYIEMMKEVARQLKLKRVFVPVRLLTPSLSRAWVSLTTGAPKNLLYPLIETLRHEMLPSPSRTLNIPGHTPLSFADAISRTLANTAIRKPIPRAFKLPSDERKKETLRSVQRLYLPHRVSARQIASLYMNWLPKKLSPFLKVRVEKGVCTFSFIPLKTPLLILTLSENRSSESRQLLYITGGLLLKNKERKARLEFRETLDHSHILAAIHDYHPALPWWLYKWTQAKLHLWIMQSFDRYLRSMPPT